MLDPRSAFLLILVLISIAVLVGFVEWRQRGLACTTCGKPHRLESEVFTCEGCGRSFCRNRTILIEPEPGVLPADRRLRPPAGRSAAGAAQGRQALQITAFNYTDLAQDAEGWCGKIEIYPALPGENEEIPHYFCRECAQSKIT